MQLLRIFYEVGYSKQNMLNDKWEKDTTYINVCSVFGKKIKNKA